MTVSSVSIVVPVYNSASTLAELVRRVHVVLPNIAQRWEIILVNDGSQDASWETIRQLSQTMPTIRGVSLRRNYGQHNALLAGIRLATGEVVVTMDDDLQHPPEAIPALLAALSQERDVVYGVPRRLLHARWRNMASWAMKVVLRNALGAHTAPLISAFRAFRTELREAFADYHGSYTSIDVLLNWATSRFGVVTVDHAPRRRGASQYTVRSLMRYTINLITGFSVWPLRAASVAGFSAVLFGILLLCYVVGRYFLEGAAPPGFPFLASVIAIFSGVQLFVLGIMGEYLARMHLRIMAHPAYVVHERCP